jgi:hypothetical protein
MRETERTQLKIMVATTANEARQPASSNRNQSYGEDTTPAATMESRGDDEVEATDAAAAGMFVSMAVSPTTAASKDSKRAISLTFQKNHLPFFLLL